MHYNRASYYGVGVSPVPFQVCDLTEIPRFHHHIKLLRGNQVSLDLVKKCGPRSPRCWFANRPQHPCQLNCTVRVSGQGASKNSRENLFTLVLEPSG
jgi:hypothetical protein